MRLTYSKDVDALAIELTLDGRTATSKRIGHDITADFDKEGRLITVEILNASASYPLTDLQALDSPVVLLTLAEAAKESGLTASTLRGQLNNGRVKGEKKGRDWMIPRHELLNYLATRGPAGRPSRRRKARRAAVSA